MKGHATQSQIDARRKLIAAMRERTDKPLKGATTNADLSRFCAVGLIQDQLQQRDPNWYWRASSPTGPTRPNGIVYLYNKKVEDHEWVGDAYEYRDSYEERFGTYVSISTLRILCVENHFAIDNDEWQKLMVLNDDRGYSWPLLAAFLDANTSKLWLVPDETLHLP